MQEITPSPWRLIGSGTHFNIFGDNDKILIAGVTGFDSDDTKANASLIAAAPDLLDACERAMEYLTTKYPKEADIFSQLKAAISKATE